MHARHSNLLDQKKMNQSEASGNKFAAARLRYTECSRADTLEFDHE
jgi:hypothetical protein